MTTPTPQFLAGKCQSWRLHLGAGTDDRGMEGDRELKQQVQDLLMGLGDTRTQVAKTLRTLGVRATPKDPVGCAIAVYLRAILGGDRRVRSLSVHNSSVKVHLGAGRRLRWPNLVSVLLPDPIRQFILAFDEAVYPDLMCEGLDDPSARIHTEADGR